MISNLDLHIDELVLEGFPEGSHAEIAAAVRSELARIFAEADHLPPSLAQNKAVRYVDGGSFQVHQDASPQAVGNQVAQAIYGGLRE